MGTSRLSLAMVMAILLTSLVATMPASATWRWSGCTEVGEGPAPELADEFEAAYDDAPVDLGAPVSGPYGCLNRWAGVWTQKFFGPEGETNLIYNEDHRAAYRLYGDYLDRYIEKGGPAVMGVPTDNPTPRGDGIEQYFNGGSIGTAAMYRRDGDPIFITQGAIQEKYYRLGGTSSDLGFPVSDEYAIDGPVNIIGGLSLTGGVARSDFENGSLIYHCVSGSVDVKSRGSVDVGACGVDALDENGRFILF